MEKLSGALLRNSMLETFGKMLKPARIIMNLSEEELSKLSGIPENVIAEIESGERSFTSTNYIAAASVLDNAGYSSDRNIYEAVVKILTPDSAYEVETGDFILVRRWLRTFTAGEAEIQYDDTPSTILTDTEIDRIVMKYKIFADTSSVEDESFPKLVDRLEPFLRKYDAALIIPKSVINDLNDDYVASGDEEEELSAKETMDYVKHCEAESIITVRGNDAGTDTYEELSAIFDKVQGGYRFALITQDIETAKAVSDSNNGRQSPVIVLRFDEGGNLMIWNFPD